MAHEMASKTTLIGLEYALRQRSHIIALPENPCGVISGTAMYFWSGFQSKSGDLIENEGAKSAQLLVTEKTRQKMPLTWPSAAFLTYDPVDAVKWPEEPILWLWGVNRPKSMISDRKDRMIRRPLVRKLAYLAQRTIQVSTIEKSVDVIHKSMKDYLSGVLETFNESRPGGLVELVYDLKSAFSHPPDDSYLIFALKSLFASHEEARRDPVLQQFYGRMTGEVYDV
jgi:hypothetical protein